MHRRRVVPRFVKITGGGAQIKRRSRYADHPEMDEQPYAVTLPTLHAPARTVRSRLPLAIGVFLSPALWMVALLVVVFPGTLHDASRRRDPALLNQLGAVAALAVLAMLIPLALGLRARSSIARGLSLAVCSSMVLVGAVLLAAVAHVPIVGLAGVHLVVAGLTAGWLLLTPGTRSEFRRGDETRDQALQTDADRVIRLAWSDFGPLTRALLGAAALLAVAAGLSTKVRMNVIGTISFPTPSSVGLLAASLGCGFAAALLTHRRK